MKRQNVKKVVNEVVKVTKKGTGKKVLKAAGAVTVLAGITVICYGAYKKYIKPCDSRDEKKLTNEEIDKFVEILRQDTTVVSAFAGFQLDVADLNSTNVVANDGDILAFEVEGIIVKVEMMDGESFKVSVYRDPLYDFMMAQES